MSNNTTLLVRSETSDNNRIETLYNALQGVYSSKQLERFYECGQHAWLKHKICGGIARQTKRCKMPFCKHCGTVAKARTLAKYEQYIRRMRMPRMLTLSTPNVVHLSGGEIKLLKQQFRTYRNRHFPAWIKEQIRLTGHCRHTPGDYLRAGLIVLEVKNNGEAGYNLHLHILYDGFFAPRPVYIQMGRVWDKVVGIEHANHKITTCKGRGHALNYLKSYLKKEEEFSNIDDEIAYYKMSKGTKAVMPFGNYVLTKKRKEELLRLEANMLWYKAMNAIKFPNLCPNCGVDQEYHNWFRYEEKPGEEQEMECEC